MNTLKIVALSLTLLVSSVVYTQSTPEENFVRAAKIVAENPAELDEQAVTRAQELAEACATIEEFEAALAEHGFETITEGAAFFKGLGILAHEVQDDQDAVLALMREAEARGNWARVLQILAVDAFGEDAVIAYVQNLLQ